MGTRMEMNSNSLQNNFVQVYEKFFSKNDLVISGCFNFPWGYEGGGHKSTHITVKTKIPLKCYVGIRKINSSGCFFKEVTVFDITKNSFEEIPYEKINKESKKVEEIIKEYLIDNCFSNGIEISILSETGRGHSFGFSGTSAALISAGIFTLLKKVPSSIFSNYEEFLNSPEFYDTFNLSRKIDFVSRYGNGIGENAMHTLINTHSPSYFLCEEFSNSMDINKIDDVKYEHAIIPKKFNECVFDSCKLDYFMVFSGIKTDTKEVEHFKKGISQEFSNFSNFIEQELVGNSLKNVYVKKLAHGEPIIQKLSDITTFLNVKTIELFKEMLSSYNSSTVDRFIDHINNYRHALSLIEEQSEFAEDFIYLFKKNQKNYQESIGIFPGYSGSLGGGYVVVTKPGISRETITEAVAEMKNKYPNICIEFSSFEDGESSDGIKVEQFVSEEKFSKYVSRDQVYFKNNFGESYVGKYNEILENESQGLVLDNIGKKIYLNGEKLTSKEILSQNTTCEILTTLFKNFGKDIPSKQFPSSSYSKNKNEMLGKIVMPLVTLIENKTGIEFPLICKGGLNDFYLKLDETKVKMGIIERM